MLETVTSPVVADVRRAGMRVLAKPERKTLRELLRFFTGRVGVHFKREAVLITALRRVIGRGHAERNEFENLLFEHRVLKADAAAIAKKLGSTSPSVAEGNGNDPYGIRPFIRHYRGHISCEERILFVLAQMRLTPGQRQRISQRMLQV
jgi:hemerythrin-like domain-containing protein